MAAGGPGDALVMCPAEGDSLGAAKDLTAGPVSPPPGIKAGNMLPLMASDSSLNYIGVLKERVVICAREGCSTGAAGEGGTEEAECETLPRVRECPITRQPQDVFLKRLCRRSWFPDDEVHVFVS